MFNKISQFVNQNKRDLFFITTSLIGGLFLFLNFTLINEIYTCKNTQTNTQFFYNIKKNNVDKTKYCLKNATFFREERMRIEKSVDKQECFKEHNLKNTCSVYHSKFGNPFFILGIIFLVPFGILILSLIFFSISKIF